ncbi:Uncharacterised protein [Moraxella lacunata]|uniref:Uncharacterized protein n=1 Tax=Moraxella lacunata TaxID=477 RepID=A0A378TV32_MORLA|nr:hypothetical protein [Moraxella lacunata]STZ63850.1 Uncharacterised protein [Moraxella lacunata]
MALFANDKYSYLTSKTTKTVRPELSLQAERFSIMGRQAHHERKT